MGTNKKNETYGQAEKLPSVDKSLDFSQSTKDCPREPTQKEAFQLLIASDVTPQQINQQNSDLEMGRTSLLPSVPVIASQNTLPKNNSSSLNEIDGERKKRGRPKILDEKCKAKICAYIEMGLSLRQAAAQVGCVHSTIVREKQRDLDFSAEIDSAQRKGEIQPLMHIIRASKHSWRAAAWLVRNHRLHAGLRREEEEHQEKEMFESIERINEALTQNSDGKDQENLSKLIGEEL